MTRSKTSADSIPVKALDGPPPNSGLPGRTGPLDRLKSGRTVCLTFGRTVQQTSPDLNLCERFCGQYLTYLNVFLIAVGLINVFIS